MKSNLGTLGLCLLFGLGALAMAAEDRVRLPRLTALVPESPEHEPLRKIEPVRFELARVAEYRRLPGAVTLDSGDLERAVPMSRVGFAVEIPLVPGLAGVRETKVDPLLMPEPVWPGGPLGRRVDRLRGLLQAGEPGRYSQELAEFWRAYEAATKRREGFGASDGEGPRE